MYTIKKELDNFENVKYIDVMEDFEKALQYNIRKAPTVIILENGEEINRFSGFKTKRRNSLLFRINKNRFEIKL